MVEPGHFFKLKGEPMNRKLKRWLAVVIVAIVLLCIPACDVEGVERLEVTQTVEQALYADQVIERAMTLTAQAGGSR